MDKIRICQLITELRPAGAERCVFELARRLDRQRFDVHVAALRGGAVADWLTREGIGTTILDLRGKWDLAKLTQLSQLFRRRKFHILHTHLFHADLAGHLASLTAEVPRIVHTVHTAEGRWLPWQYAWAHWARYDRIICVSQSVLEHHSRRSWIEPSLYQVIPNGVDTASFVRDERQRGELRKEWGVGEQECLVAYLGRLAPEKGLDVFLEAVRRLYIERQSQTVESNNMDRLYQNPAVPVVIAGDGPLAPMLHHFQKSAAASRTQWLGYIENVRGVLSAADLLVMPSRWEGFGLSAAEALAAGVPVIASDVAGLRDVVSHNVSGLLVKRDDPSALADAMRQLMQDPARRQRLALAGQRYVGENFDISRNISQHQQLYEQLASIPETVEPTASGAES